MNREDVESILKDYHWMINSIKIMRQSLEHADEGITAQYGIEATLPKPQGVNSDQVYREVVRRSKYWKRIEQYEKKVSIIQERLHAVSDEREIEVLHWLLEGKSYRWIARHMGLSERQIRRIKDSIVTQMSDMPKTPKTSKSCV